VRKGSDISSKPPGGCSCWQCKSLPHASDSTQRSPDHGYIKVPAGRVPAMIEAWLHGLGCLPGRNQARAPRPITAACHDRVQVLCGHSCLSHASSGQQPLLPAQAMPAAVNDHSCSSHANSHYGHSCSSHASSPATAINGHSCLSHASGQRPACLSHASG
jgi:hypothetical protein